MWWAITGMALITFFNRYAFFADFVRYSPGAKVKRFLSYSSYAVLTAIWAPIVFSVDTQTGFTHAGADYLIGVSVAAALSLLRVPSIVVVLTSAAVFFGIRFVI